MAPEVCRHLHRRAVLSSLSAAALGPLRTTASTSTPAILLPDGSPFPVASFGIQIYDDDTARELTLLALEAGFRSFFTSPEGGNQKGFARGIRDSGVPRSQLFIAGTVLSDDAIEYRRARTTTAQRCDESLETLASSGIEDLDMLMLERPGLDAESIRGQWRALQEAKSAGRARSLGVCNFDLPQLDDCLRTCGSERPQINQIQYTLAIRMQHAATLAEHRKRQMRVMAFSPLGGPTALIPRSTLDECSRIGRRYRKNRYQVALRWLVQQGVPYSVHSRSLAHLREDLDVLSFALSEGEMSLLTTLSEAAPAYS